MKFALTGGLRMKSIRLSVYSRSLIAFLATSSAGCLQQTPQTQLQGAAVSVATSTRGQALQSAASSTGADQYLRIEAESMTLRGFHVVSDSSASGGAVIELNAGEQGVAAFRFNGATGVYHIIAAYQGYPQSAQVGGVIVLNANAPIDGADLQGSQTILRRTLGTEVSVSNGEIFEFEVPAGSMNRIDYLEFSPITLDPSLLSAMSIIQKTHSGERDEGGASHRKGPISCHRGSEPNTGNLPAPIVTPIQTITPTPVPTPTRTPAPVVTPTPAVVSFSKTILPVLQSSCTSCHSQAGSYSGVTGAGWVSAGNVSGSLLASKTAANGSMARHAPAGLNANINAWISAGAPNN